MDDKEQMERQAREQAERRQAREQAERRETQAQSERRETQEQSQRQAQERAERKARMEQFLDREREMRENEYPPLFEREEPEVEPMPEQRWGAEQRAQVSALVEEDRYDEAMEVVRQGQGWSDYGFRNRADFEAYVKDPTLYQAQEEVDKREQRIVDGEPAWQVHGFSTPGSYRRSVELNWHPPTAEEIVAQQDREVMVCLQTRDWCQAEARKQMERAYDERYDRISTPEMERLQREYVPPQDRRIGTGSIDDDDPRRFITPEDAKRSRDHYARLDRLREEEAHRLGMPTPAEYAQQLREEPAYRRQVEQRAHEMSAFGQGGALAYERVKRDERAPDLTPSTEPWAKEYEVRRNEDRSISYVRDGKEKIRENAHSIGVVGEHDAQTVRDATRRAHERFGPEVRIQTQDARKQDLYMMELARQGMRPTNSDLQERFAHIKQTVQQVQQRQLAEMRREREAQNQAQRQAQGHQQDQGYSPSL